jgi:hypothetical protein
MSLVPTFPWTAFVFAVRNRNRANKNEIAVLVFSVTTNNFPHVHTPFLYGTDVTALRYRIPDVAPLNEVCTGLKAEASRAYVLSIFQSDSLVASNSSADSL